MVMLTSTKIFVICVHILFINGACGNIVASRWTSPEKLSALVQNGSSLTDSSSKTFQKAPRITGITIDHKKSSLFVYMSQYRKISMIRNFDGTFNNMQAFEVVRAGVSHGFGSVAFDWLTENLYWTDSMHNWIAMQPAYSKDQSMFKILISDSLEQPEGLAIDPLSRYIFWSDCSDREKIERSTLSGSQRTLLVFKSLKRVFSLVADVDTKKLYWVDYSRATLESCDYNGKNRHVVRRTNGWYPTAVDISSTHIFTVIHKGKVLRYNKMTEEYEKAYNVDNVRVIRLMNTTFQQKQIGINRCENSNCPHMCVNTAADTSLCVCKEGFQYFPSTNECRATTNYFSKGVIVSDGSRICMVTINAVSNGSSSHRCTFIGSSVVGAIAVQSDRVIYHEKTTGNLKFVRMNGASNTYLIANNLGSISDLEYDWVDEKLFWIDNTMSSIKMADVNNPAERTTVTDNLRDPQSLAIDVKAKLVFWSALDQKGGSTRRIYRCSFTGSDITAIGSLTRVNPQGLFMDIRRDRLFWIDERLVKSVRTNGSDYKTFGSLTTESKYLLIYQDYAVWTNSTPVIFSKYLASKNDPTYTSPLASLSSVTDIALFDQNLWTGKKGRCTIDNGGCEQICLPGKPTPICQCELGFKLQNDKKSCSSGSQMDSFALLSDATNDRIYQLSLNGSVIKGIKIDDLDSPMTVEYHPGLGRLFIPEHSSGQLKSTAVDGSDVSTLFVSGSAYPSDLGIDMSTNQIFFLMATKNPSRTKSYVAVIRIDTLVQKTLVPGLGDPRSLAIHPEKGILFWTDLGAFTHIGKSAMDGTGNTTIISTDIKWPQGITIDYIDNLLYWSDGSKNKIESCDFNGGNRRQILVDNSAHITDLMIRGSYLYYVSWNKRKVTKADKKTGQIIPWMSDYPEFGRLDGIDFYPKDITPENILCKSRNGDCSTFCLPTPRSRVCGCEDGVKLLSDRKRCENVDLCPVVTIKNGTLSPYCLRYANQKCSFTCDDGFIPRNGSSYVTCGALGRWVEDMRTVCEVDLCPVVTIKNGTLSPYCLRYANQKCSFTCDDGFIPRNGSTYVTCGALGRWVEDMTTVCEDIKEAERLQGVTGQERGKLSNNQSLIIGASVGGGVFLVLLMIVAVFFMFRKRSQSMPGVDNIVYTDCTNSVFRKSEGSTYEQLKFL